MLVALIVGIGHAQLGIFKSLGRHQFEAGGILRRRRRGRSARPLSTREPLHVVFKVDRLRLMNRGLRTNTSFKLIHYILRKYATHFWVRIDQVSIQHDHIHLLVRTKRRSQFHHFFRVSAGQIAQRFEFEGLLRPVTDTPGKTNGTSTASGKGTGLWLYRPFSRVVRGWRAYKIVRDYIQLNEQEALGKIPYRKQRLKGLSSSDWEILWS